MAVRTVLAIQTLFLVVLSKPESLPELKLVTFHFPGIKYHIHDMSGGCVGEAIELGASGSRTGRAVKSRSRRFRQSMSELRSRFFEIDWVFGQSTRRVSILLSPAGSRPLLAVS